MMENDGEALRANVGGARNIARRLLKDAKTKDIPISLYKVIEYLKRVKPKHYQVLVQTKVVKDF